MNKIFKNKILKIVDKKPPTYSSSLILNVLGFQLLRIAYYNMTRVMRGKVRVSELCKPYLEELEKQGYCVINDFLTQDQYQKFVRDFTELEKQFVRENKGLALPYVDAMNFYDEKVSDAFRKLFLGNEIIKETPLAYLNKKMRLQPEARLTKIYLEDMSEATLPQNGGTNNLHADVPMRTLKCFYYVTDTDEQNAALKYCTGSNIMTFSRLWVEYKTSVRYSLNKWKTHQKGQYPTGKPWVELTPSEIKALDLRPESLSVKGNSMVLVDIGGFHLRGEFKSLTPRRTIEINYRQIDSLRNAFYPLEKIILGK